jgi:hypothetical protein
MPMPDRQLNLQPEPQLQSRLAAPPPGAAPARPMRFEPSPEHTARQDLIFLLQTAAEIEHSLLVEYLYAAYSINPNLAVPNAGATTTADWKNTILQIAKEEMGHLVTVQNILRYVGGPLHLDRQHFPYRSELYPFPFALQRLTKKSLAKYVYAEMPEQIPPGFVFLPGELEEIERFAREDAGGAGLNHVGQLYMELIRRFGAFQDRDFPTDTSPWQATYLEWKADNDDPAAQPATGVTVYTVTSVDKPGAKDSSVSALKGISIQGEGEPSGVPSGAGPAALNRIWDTHFGRFLLIYRAFPNTFDPSLPVASNPNTTAVPVIPPTDVEGAEDESKYRNSRITQAQTLLWAHLFNVRYRMLLTDIIHALSLPTGNLDSCCKPAPAGAQNPIPSPRSTLVRWAFADMKMLSRLAPILNSLDRTDVVTDGKAGPPFELPYSLDLPDRHSDRWLVHRGLLRITQKLAEQLLKQVTDPTQHNLLEDITDPTAASDKVRERLKEVEKQKDFLANYSATRLVADPIREAISILAFHNAGKPKRAGELVKSAVKEGLIKTLLPGVDPANEGAAERALGHLFRRDYVNETFTVHTATDNAWEKITYRLLKKQGRFDEPHPHYRYIFEEIGPREAVAQEPQGLVLEKPGILGLPAGFKSSIPPDLKQYPVERA